MALSGRIGVAKEPNEAVYEAPSGGPNGDRRANRQTVAQHIVDATGAFAGGVTSYKALVEVARTQGATDHPRGACRVCGQLGHFTRQCKNHLSTHFKGSQAGAAAGAALLADGIGGDSSSGLSDMPGVGDSSDDDSGASKGEGKAKRVDGKLEAKESKKEKKREEKKEKKRKRRKEKEEKRDRRWEKEGKVKKHKKSSSSSRKSSKKSSKRASRSRSPGRSSGSKSPS